MASIFLHGVVSVLVFVVVSFGVPNSKPFDRIRGFWAAILFSCHAVHGDVVFQVAGCAESLYTLLLLLALACYIRGHRLLAVLIAPGLAMFAKEQGILATPTLLAYSLVVDFVHKKCARPFDVVDFLRRWIRRERVLFLASFVVLLVKFFFLVGALPHYDAVQNPAAHESSTFVRIASHHNAVWRHFLLLLWPETLSIDWSAGSVPLVGANEDVALVLIPVVCLYIGIATIGVGYVLFGKQADRSHRIYVGSALVLLIVPFIPASNLL